MTGLNKIFRNFEKLRGKYLRIFPEGKVSINFAINSILEIYESLLYEKKRGHTKRGENVKDIPVESILVLLNENLNKLDQLNMKQMDDFLSTLDAKLEELSWNISLARKNINKVLKKLEKISEKK